MGKANNRPDIRTRREKILILMSRGYSQSDICEELGITRQTIASDMKYINEITKRGLFGLAKETLSTMYYNCIQSIEQIQKECWNRYNTNITNTFNEYHKHAALELLRKCARTKFEMFASGPAYLELNKMQSELDKIIDDQDANRSYYRNPVVDFSKQINNGKIPFKDFEGLDK